MSPPIKILFATLFFIIISSCTATNSTPIRVDGTAMLPGFKDGDRVLVDKNISGIKRGDVIFFKYPKDTSKLYFKRIIALPDETVSINEGKVFINGTPLDEPYVDPAFNQTKSSLSPRKISAGSYFVLGDNRDNSSDSRYWGTVKEDLIVGRHYLTY